MRLIPLLNRRPGYGLERPRTLFLLFSINFMHQKFHLFFIWVTIESEKFEIRMTKTFYFIFFLFRIKRGAKRTDRKSVWG